MTKHLWPFAHDQYVDMLFRQMPGAIWATDRELRLTYIAGRLANNMTPRAEPGMSVHELLATREDGNQLIACHLAAISGESQSFAHQFNGRWYQLFIEQLTGNSGEVTGCIGAAFDITHQRAIQERLTQSEALLAQAQRVAHIGSFEWDITSNVVTWSDELYRIYGLEPGHFNVTHETFFEQIHPDDLERTKSSVFDALRTGSSFIYENRIVRTDGNVRILHTRGEVVKDESGKPQRMVGCSWEVTELREAMDHLERARSLLKAALEASADGLLVVDRDGNITVYNQRFLSLWKISDDLMGQKNDEKLREYVLDQLSDTKQFLCSTREIYHQPAKESFDIQRFKDGRVFERYSKAQRLGEEIVGRVWSFRDVTERERLLRQALFLSDATRLLGSLNIESALESVAHLAVPLMGEGCAIDLIANGGPRRLAYVSGEGIRSFSPELYRVMAGHSTIYSMGTRSLMAVPLVVKGAVVGAMSFIGPSMGRYGQPDLDFAETLARRAALSVENARLYRKAQEAVRARDEFLTVAAHEIRGPITSVHLAVQGLQKGRAPASATAKLLEIIEREDRRLGRFVNELLDLGKIQSGRMYFNAEEVDLGSVVREAASSLGAELSRSGSTLSITTDGHPVGLWDKHSLNQVATNLLLNAIKFGAGKPIAITVREHQGHTTLEVKDGGIGMHPETLDRIFKPFQRGVSVRNYGGLGLGLFIVRTIVEGLGGLVRVQSKPGKGSTFTVELKNSRTP